MSYSDETDFIIIGAGSAGCTLANRLTEDPDAEVTVVEAGGWDRDPLIRIPLGWGKIFGERLHDWLYMTEPEGEMNGRAMAIPRGKVIGGSSSVNAMGYARGHAGDYDRWASYGLPQWSYSHVLPYFRRLENWEDGESLYRGAGGPLRTQWTRFKDPLLDAYMRAGQDAGFPYTLDYNGAQQEGFGRAQMTIRKGRRHSAAAAYLHPALGRKNLKIMVDVVVTRILIENGKARGIEFDHGGELRRLYARREVILSAGTYNSPQLLKLSGIGDPEELAAHDIPVQVSLPGVGKNLQDHVSALVGWSRHDTGPFLRSMRTDRVVLGLAGAHFFGKGAAIDLPGGHLAFLKSDPSLPYPDIHLYFNAGPFEVGPYFTKVPPDMFGVRVAVLRPESRGDVTLRSADPRAPVRIRQNYLSRDRDAATLRAGLRIASDIHRQTALSAYLGPEVVPGPDNDLDEHIRATSHSINHPVGTCKMGLESDETAVVDSEMNVFGVEGLRVIDASVMPDLLGGHINGPVIMMAEKMADIIRGRAPLPPAVLRTAMSG